jgi:hypothetical protein
VDVEIHADGDEGKKKKKVEINERGFYEKVKTGLPSCFRKTETYLLQLRCFLGDPIHTEAYLGQNQFQLLPLIYLQM